MCGTTGAHHDHAGLGDGLAGHLRVRVLLQVRVQHRVRDLVTHLVYNTENLRLGILTVQGYTPHPDADPDSDFLFDADPDPNFHLMRIRLRIQILATKIGSYSIPYILA